MKKLIKMIKKEFKEGEQIKIVVRYPYKDRYGSDKDKFLIRNIERQLNSLRMTFQEDKIKFSRKEDTNTINVEVLSKESMYDRQGRIKED